jgi:hypothetical protein
MSLDESPAWVPGAVRGEALRLFADAQSDEEKSLLRKLLTDERMRGVWRELGNPIRSPACAAVRDEWPGGAVPDGLTDQEVAIALFFFRAYQCAQHKVQTMTLATWEEKHQLRLRLTRQLRQDATLLELNWFGDREAEAHAAAIWTAANFFERREMELFLNPSPALVKRNQGDPHLRAYAVIMASVARRLFGNFNYGTIAKLTNVALEPSVEVSTANVRDWRESRYGS